jgi:hypothetical protein
MENSRRSQRAGARNYERSSVPTSRWVLRGDHAEGEEWCSTFLARTTGEPRVRGRALLALATLKRDRAMREWALLKPDGGKLASLQPLFEESLTLCRLVDGRFTRLPYAA